MYKRQKHTCTELKIFSKSTSYHSLVEAVHPLLCALLICWSFMKQKYQTYFKSISFIATSLLQFTRHSTDLVQYSLNHNCINLHNFLHNNVWYLQTTFLEALDWVCDKINYGKSVWWNLYVEFYMHGIVSWWKQRVVLLEIVFLLMYLQLHTYNQRLKYQALWGSWRVKV